MVRKLINESTVAAVFALSIGAACAGDARTTNVTYRPGELDACNDAFIATVTELSGDAETVRIRFASGIERLLSTQERRMVEPIRVGMRVCLQDDAD